MSDFENGYAAFFAGESLPEDFSEDFEEGYRMAFEDSVGVLTEFKED